MLRLSPDSAFTETVHLNATPAKGLYTFDYVRATAAASTTAGAPWS
ncbi:hypothetical protein [Streptomyces sp. H27-H5]|nr:hypothetical protein [Streptomyces sp. H27-H5]MCY0963198.1 hypothetical protein [Streptomyces sp. H27-H5]